jgi:hypothetical protein
MMMMGEDLISSCYLPGESIPFPQDSSSVMEWAQCPGEERSTPQQAVVEQQQSYETEWDMINAVSFPKRKPCSNGEGGWTIGWICCNSPDAG